VTLSIIIPSYNTEKLLACCLHSIYRQTKETDYEVIVVDNGSNYNIKHQIRQLADKKLKIKLIQNQCNLGFAKACNQGLKKTAGDYILFLNSDTIILDEAIDKAVNLLKKNKNIDILGCQLLNSDKTIQPSAGYLPKLRQIFYMMFFIDDLPFLKEIIKPFHQQAIAFYQKDRAVDWVTGAFLLVRREVVDKIKGFDEDYFMYAEEVDFCYRAKKAGFGIFYTPSARIIHLKEASPRLPGERAVLGEYKGLKLFFQKNKPAWELPILRFLLKIGALLRVFVFGILLNNGEKKQAYLQAFKLV